MKDEFSGLYQVSKIDSELYFISDLTGDNLAKVSDLVQENTEVKEGNTYYLAKSKNSIAFITNKELTIEDWDLSSVWSDGSKDQLR